MVIAENADLHRDQRAFRIVLDRFARPGTVGTIEPAAANPARPAELTAAVEEAARLFVDQAVRFAVADPAPEGIAEYLTSETHARRDALARAPFVIVPNRADAAVEQEAVAQACSGTLLAPETGATVIIGCTAIEPAANDAGETTAADDCVAGKDAADGEGTGSCETGSAATRKTRTGMHEVSVQGPGVESVNRFAVDRIAWAAARARRGDEFPCGIDILLVDTRGNVVAIPRTSALAVDGNPLRTAAASDGAPGADDAAAGAEAAAIADATAPSAPAAANPRTEQEGC